MSDYLVQVENLCKSFGAIKATDDLCLSIERNQLHALIGPNGAGKTTLVNQLTGDMSSDSGKILYNGRNIVGWKGYKRARLGIARSFQITHIFSNLTVEENMALALYAQNGHNFNFLRHWRKYNIAKEKLTEALERVGLINRKTLKASHLSHGEKRQLEVGMALATDPELLILDEPMAGMGPGGTVELSKLINKLKDEITILLVEHDMEVVFSLADQVTVLVYGKNIASGTPAEIKQNSEVRTAYLGEAADA